MATGKIPIDKGSNEPDEVVLPLPPDASKTTPQQPLPKTSRAVVFVDLKKRNDEERQRLGDRQFELDKIKRENDGVLPPILEQELQEIIALLNHPVVDPFFIKIQETLAKTSPPKVGDHIDGKFPSQLGASPAPLTDPEQTLAGVYGLLEQDNITHPKTSRFVKAVSEALGEYTSFEDLFANVLPILIAEGVVGNESRVSAEQWVAVVRTLRTDGVQADDYLLPLKVRVALASVDGAIEGAPSSAIVIDLPDLEAQSDVEIVADNLHAMQAIYFSSMLEELKVFQVIEKLVELFHYGMLPLGKGRAGDFLYGYWKKSSDRFTEMERRNLYARAFGLPGGDPAQIPNREFDNAWLRFLSAVSTFARQLQVDSLLRASIPVNLNQEQVRKAGRDLGANLSLHGYGIAYFAATELQQQIRDVIDLLSDQEIRLAFGARDMWQVIDQVATLELGGAKNSIRYRTMAQSGAIIIRWVANRAHLLSGATLVDVIDIRALRNPIPRPSSVKPTVEPTDYDLVNACEQWLAVNGIPDVEVENYSQPAEAPMTTSRPIQIPAAAKDLLESVGISAGVNNGHGYYPRR